MRADLVVQPAERLGFVGQGDGIGDLEAEQVLVLDRAVEPFDDAVGLRRVMAGSDVGELGSPCDEASEVGALVGRAVVGVALAPHSVGLACTTTRERSTEGRLADGAASLEVPFGAKSVSVQLNAVR